MGHGAGTRGTLRLAGLGVAAVLVADMVGLAVHGPAATAQSIRAVVQAASAHTMSSGTARISMDLGVKTEGSSLHQTLSSTMEGVGDLAGHSLDMTTVSGPGAGSELRVVDGVTYERPAPGQARPGVTTPWISLPATVPLSGPPSPGTIANNDPTQTLSQLEGLSNGTITGAQDEGTAPVRGVATTAYRLELDVAALQAQTRRYTTGLGLNVSNLTYRSLTMEIWIDPQGRIRRQRTAGDVSASFGSMQLNSHTTVTVDFYDFGIAVNIQPPPSSQVTPVSSPS